MTARPPVDDLSTVAHRHRCSATCGAARPGAANTPGGPDHDSDRLPMAIPTVPLDGAAIQGLDPLPDDAELIAAVREALEILVMIDNPPVYLRPEYR